MSARKPHSPNRGLDCLFTISKLADQRRVSLRKGQWMTSPRSFPSSALLPLVPGGILGLDGLEQAAADNAGAIFSITG